MPIDPTSTAILDNVLQEFTRALQADYGKIQHFAKSLFYYLAGIQIAISALWMMFKNDPIDAVVKTIQMIFTISVFYTLVLFGGRWMPQIINGFISIGSSSAGISSLTPSSVMDQGLSIGFAVMDGFGNWGLTANFFGGLLSCVVLVAIVILYAFLAAETAIILVKSFILVSLSGLMFAFGANEVVRPISINYFKAVIGIGLQLLTFYLIMGVGVSIGRDWANLMHIAAQEHAIKPFLVVLAAVIVFYLIAKNVPPFIAGLSGITGFRSYGDAAIGAVGASMAVGGMSIAGVQKIGSVGVSGVQAGGQLTKGGYQTTKLGMHHSREGASVTSAIGHAAKHAFKAVGGAIKDGIMKNHPEKSFGQRFNMRMSEKLAQQAASSASKGEAPKVPIKTNQVQK